MITWNSNAFLTHDPERAEENARVVEGWIKRHQFVILPEAHYTDARLATFLKRHQQFLGWGTAYGDPDKDHSTGGLLILASRRYVEESFLPPECKVVMQGRCMVLTMVSKSLPKATLQVVGVYGAAGPQGCAERRRLWGELDRHILPEDQSQCWMAGGFNFVEMSKTVSIRLAGRATARMLKSWLSFAGCVITTTLVSWSSI